MKKQSQKSSKTGKKSAASSMRLALENRLLFDGALVATAEVIDDKTANQDHPVQQDADSSITDAVFGKDDSPGAAANVGQNDSFGQQPAPVTFGSPDAPNLIVADPRAEDLQQVLTNMAPDTQVKILDSTQNGYQQVADILGGRGTTGEVNILTANVNGKDFLGSTAINSTISSIDQANVGDWGDSLTRNTDVLFHGTGGMGQMWLDQMTALSGGRIAWTTEGLSDKSTDAPQPAAETETILADNKPVDSKAVAVEDKSVQAISPIDEPADGISLVFVDTSVQDYQTLIEGIEPKSTIILIDSNRDGVEQIAQTVAQYDNVSAIHIISHGQAGQINLGTAVLDQSTIQGIYADELASMGSHLTANADILIYGCNFGQGEIGLQASTALGSATGADVADSVDDTGATALGGDWILERQVGAIETPTLQLTTWNGLLAFTNTNVGGAWTFTSAAANTATVPTTAANTTDGITTTVSLSGAAGVWSSTSVQTLNNIAAFNNSAQNTADFQTTFDSANAANATGTVTITFSKAVTNPIIHIDRLGGVDGGGLSNSSVWSLATSGATLTRLAGPSHFLTTATTFQRQTGIATAGTESSLTNATGTAAGSVQVNGTFTTLTFTVTGSAGDGVELAFAIDAPPIAVTDAFTTPHDSAIGINVRANDTDPRGDALTVTKVNGTALTAGGSALTLADGSGSVSLNAGGNLIFAPTPNYVGASTFTYTIADANGGESTATVTGSVTNIAPRVDLDSTVAGTNFTTAYTENGAGVSIASANDVITDADDTNIESATITLTNAQLGDLLVAGVLPFGITASAYNPATGLITLSGSSSLANYQAAIRAITFSNTTDSLNTTARTINVVVNDGNAVSNTAVTTINVTAINDAPVNTLPALYTTNEDTSVPLTGLSISDADAGSGPITVNLFTASGNGTFSATAAGGVTVAGSGSNNLTLTGTVANINAFLAGATRPSFLPGLNVNGDVTIRMTTNDGGNTGIDPGLTGTATSEEDIDFSIVRITPINDAPTVTVPALGVLTTNEDTPLTITGITFADPDAGTSSVTVTISIPSSAGALSLAATPGVGASYNAGTGVLTLTGQYGNISTAIAGGALTYSPAADFNTSVGGPITLAASINDNGNVGGGALIANASTNITVAAVPDIVADTVFTNANTAISYDPVAGTNGASADNFEGTPAITAINGTAIAAGGSVAVANGTVNLAATGNVLTFTPAANFTGTTTYTYTVTSGGVTETATETVNIRPQITINDVIVNEAAGTATFTVSLSSTSVQTVTVAYNTTDGSAVQPGDYTSATGTLTFAPGTTTQTITVPIVNDTILEGDETFNVNLVSPINATIADNLGLGTILANDPLSVSIADAATVDEGQGLQFTVSLTGGTSTTDITVPLTYAGTATPVLDYNGQPTFVTIPAGQTTATVTVPTLADGLLEGPEAVLVNLGAPSGQPTGAPAVTVADGQGLGIIDDSTPNAVDDGPIATVSNSPVGGNVLTNDSDPNGDLISVTQFTIDGIPGSFPAGTTATIPGIGTLVINPNGTFTFDPIDGYDGPVPNATYTITDGTATETAVLSFANVPNTPPNAVNDGPAVTEPNTPLRGNVLTNDNDPDGDPLEVAQFTIPGIGTFIAGQTASIPGIGTLVINSDGTYSFTPNQGYNGSVPSATYTVSDPTGATGTAIISFADVPNRPPIAANDGPIQTTPNAPTRGDVLANDRDPDGDPLTVTQFAIAGVGTFPAARDATIPGVGKLVIRSDGTYSFTPNTGYAGPVPRVSYTVSDGTDISTAILRFADVPSAGENIGAIIQLANPTPPLFPLGTGGAYSLPQFRELDLLWASDKPRNPSQLSLSRDWEKCDLYLRGSLRNQVVIERQHYSFSVPRESFVHCNINEELEFVATQNDGSPLPDWLRFDPKQFKFTGVPLKDARNIEVMITAQDQYGNRAHATFKVTVNKERGDNQQDSIKPKTTKPQQSPHHHVQTEPMHQYDAKLAFKEQLNNSSKLSRLMESRALLDSLSQL